MNIRKFVISACIVPIFLSSLNVCADSPTRNNNVFYVNGKNYTFTNTQLGKIRKSWLAIKPDNDWPLKRDDKQWVLDFIAIDRIYSNPPCGVLILHKIVPRKSMTDNDDGTLVQAWYFDEAWHITACGKQFVYRVFIPLGTKSIATYQMSPRLKLMPGTAP